MSSSVLPACLLSESPLKFWKTVLGKRSVTVVQKVGICIVPPRHRPQMGGCVELEKQQTPWRYQSKILARTRRGLQNLFRGDLKRTDQDRQK